MSKEIENLINSNNSKQNIRSALELTINRLQDLIKMLITDELISLKSIIDSQKQALAESEHEKLFFKSRINQLAAELEKSKTVSEFMLLGSNTETIDKVKDDEVDLQGEIDWLHEEISNLEKQFNSLKVENSELHKNNDFLNQRILALQKENALLCKSDDAKKHYQLEIVELEEKILNLKEQISDLEKEKERLDRYCDKLKSDRFTIAKLEKKIICLNEEITDLEIENLNLRGLPAHVPKITPRDAKEIISVEEGTGYTQKLPKIPKGTVSRMIQKRSLEKPKISIPSYGTGYEPSSLLVMEKQTPIIESSEVRMRCPNCANFNRKTIHELTDKSHLISAYPRIYGKKLLCGKCGFEWR
ncbi:MAG: hypothetical protein ACFFAH_08770 [Promethearchaeota archaeon]